MKQWILDDPRFGATARGAARPALRRRAAHPHDGRPRGAGRGRGGGRRRSCPTPTDPDAALVSIEPATGYVRAMVGGRDFFGAGASGQAQPGHAGPPAGRLVVQAARAGRRADPGHRPADDAISAPACITIPLRRTPSRGGRATTAAAAGGTVDLVEGTVRSYNTALRAADHAASGPSEAMDGADAHGHPQPARAVPVRGARHQRRHRPGHGRGLRHLRQPRHPRAPVLVTRITRADGTVLLPARAPPGAGPRRRRRRHRDRASSSRSSSAAPAPRPSSTGPRPARPAPPQD